MTRKLHPKTQTSAVEGWKWIKIALDLPYSYSHDLSSLPDDPESMTDNEGATHAMPCVDYRALEEENAGQGELPDEIDTPGAVVKKFETRSLTFDQSEVDRAGVFDTCHRYGAVAVYRRYLCPENELREETAVHNGANSEQVGCEMIVILRSCRCYHVGTMHHAGWSRQTELTCRKSKMMERSVMKLTAPWTLGLHKL